MASPSSISNDNTQPLTHALHMLSIKLSNTNYLLWKNQIQPVLAHQNLLSHIDGSSKVPAATILTDGKPTVNPDHAVWLSEDQKAIILLHASLSEEASTEIVRTTTAREIWTTLESVYCNASMERVQNLRDHLRQLRKDSMTVVEFGRKFKFACDQLFAIGHEVDAIEIIHWFLRGLGTGFEMFSTTIRNSKPYPSLRDLIAQAEGHELFLQSLHGSSNPPVAFNTETTRTNYSSNRGRGGRFNRGGRGRGRRIPHCQLCRTNGHYASSCPQLASYASRTSVPDQALAQAFQAQCHVNTPGPDWYVDSGATAHMTPAPENVPSATIYNGSNDQACASQRKM